MVSTSELRWLRSVDDSAWQVLAPVVSALPDTQLRVNINSAPPELLVAVVSGLGIDQARRVEADGPYSDLNRFVEQDRKSTRLNSSHVAISYAVFCLKKKKR